MTDETPTHEPIADGTSLKVTLGGQLRELQRWVYVTPAIIVGAIAIHAALTWETSGVLLGSDAVVKYADYGTEVANGEWWRIFTSMWLHGYPMHLVSNMVALAIIGRSVERMLGWRGFLLMYVLSGVGGALATDIAIPYTLSIGASGAVFGVYGCLVGFTVRYPGQFPSQGLSTLMWAGLVFLGYTVTFGTGPGINWVAHAGGFVTGVVCGALLTAPIEPHALPGRRWRDARLAIGGTVVIAGALFALQGRIPNLRVAVAEVFDRDAQIGERAGAAAGRVGAREIAADIEREILPALESARRYVRSLDRLPRQHRVVLSQLDHYLASRERAWRQLADGLSASDFDAVETAYWLHLAADSRRARLGDELRGLIDSPGAAPAAIAQVVDPVIEALVGRLD